MGTVTSKDGTRIAFDRSGKGPAVILVVGAFNERPTGAPLARALEQHFTVFNYDRRGRGESGDTAPYAVEREILSLRAAAQGSAISRLALFEPPPTGARAGELAPQLSEMVAAGRRGDAVELFQIEAVGIPAAIVAQLRNAPFRPALEKIAQTLVYESTILKALPDGLTASVKVPTLVIDGGQSPEVMRQAAQSLAEALPDGRYRTLEGQGHDIDPDVMGPVLEGFFLA
jgi:hypothetical protein